LRQRVYLDNNIVIYLFDKRKPEELMALSVMKESGKFEFVFSEISLWEIALTRDQKTAESIGNEIDALKPLWLKPYIEIQKLEIRNYLFNKFHGKKTKEVEPFYRSLSQLFYQEGNRLPLGISSAEIIKKWSTESKLEEAKRKYAEDLKFLQEHRSRGNYTKKHEKITFNHCCPINFHEKRKVN
jgi:hypothetical protein